MARVQVCTLVGVGVCGDLPAGHVWSGLVGSEVVLSPVEWVSGKGLCPLLTVRAVGLRDVGGIVRCPGRAALPTLLLSISC